MALETLPPAVSHAEQSHVERLRPVQIALLVSGILLATATMTVYVASGYHRLLPVLLAASVATIATSFWRPRPAVYNAVTLGESDWLAALGLLLVFAPLYLALLYEIPFQINTDEIANMSVMKSAIGRDSADWFGPGYGSPSFGFLLFGELGDIVGGINLSNIRAIHAAFGLGTIVFTYLFLRLFSCQLIAFGGAAFVGANHAHFASSRTAMIQETAPFFAIVALYLLLRGWKGKSPSLQFIGGAAAGLALYAYNPGKIAVVLWFLFLAVMLVSRSVQFRAVARVALINVFGLALVAAPLFIATARDSGGTGQNYQREQLLIFSEGREAQRQWVSTRTIAEGVRKNIWNGITVFNNDVVDHGWIYANVGHGFVDPMSGILVWIGLATVLFKWCREGWDPGEALVVSSFLFLWLLFSFVVNKAPHYTRLLIILPFAGYLVAQGLYQTATAGQYLVNRIRFGNAWSIRLLFLGGLLVVVLWNVSIFGDFVAAGARDGHDVGGTARYVAARGGAPGYSFYLAADEDFPYYGWGIPYWWRAWFGFFADPAQGTAVIAPSQVLVADKQAPFTIFMSRKLWLANKDRLLALYPEMIIHSVKPDGSLTAVEVR